MRLPLLLALSLVLVAACAPGAEETADPAPIPATDATPSPGTEPEPELVEPTRDPEATEPAPLAPDPTPEPTAEATERPTEEVGGPDLIAEASAAPRQSDGFPSLAGDVAALVDVRVAAQDGFDRVVLEFDGADVPSHRLTYVDPPIREDGSGEEVAVAGAAFLELRMTPASGVDLASPELTATYTGPDRVGAPGTAVVTEVVRTGDFEANLAWVVGLDRRTPFAFAWLTDPLRLVVDIPTG
jgi:hypothetical protein